MKRNVFAIYRRTPRGDVLQHIGLYADEDECWYIYLGWPARGEVDHAKARGFFCAPVHVVPVGK
jgi:hypothetical protein